MEMLNKLPETLPGSFLDNLVLVTGVDLKMLAKPFAMSYLFSSSILFTSFS